MGNAITADVFISRTGKDADLAIQIAAILRAAGQRVWLQDTDFGHADFMRRMEQGFESGARVVALLSGTYQKSEYCRKEYNTVLSADPGNLNERLVVLRVDDCAPVGNLQTLAYTDLVPVLHDAGALAQTIRGALKLGVQPADAISAARHQHRGFQIRAPEFQQPLRSFTGREALLAALAARLWGDEPVVALTGMAGVGKTEVARAYGWRHRDRYQGIWWVNAEDPVTMIDDLVRLGVRREPRLVDMLPSDAAAFTLDWISQAAADRPWLLVYDNVESAAAIRAQRPPSGAHVVITTRLDRWDDDADALPVAVFEQDTSVRFLVGDPATATPAELGAAQALAEALQHLPLALSHARAYCRETGLGWSAYTARLQALIRQARPDGRYPTSVFATFALAIERAAAASPHAEPLLEVLATSAPEPVADWLLDGLWSTKADFDGAVAALRRTALIDVVALDDGTRALSMHRLVQVVTRSRATEGGRWSDTVAKAADRWHRMAWTPRVDAPGQHAVWLPHAAAIVGHRDAEALDASVWIRIKAVDLHVTRGETERALAHGQRAYDIGRANHERTPGDRDRARTLSAACSRMGNLHARLGHTTEALDFYNEGVEVAERLVQHDPSNTEFQRDVSVSYEKLGDMHLRLGATAQAVSFFEKALGVAERLVQHDPSNTEFQRDVSVSYEKLGDVHLRLGATAQAISFFEKALVVRERLVQQDPNNTGFQRDVSVSYEKLGAVHLRLGATSQAVSFFEKALAVRERLVQHDPSNTGFQRDVSVSYNKLGDVHLRLGATSQAVSFFEKALAVAERLVQHDPSHTKFQRDVSVSYNQLGDVHLRLGATSQAVSFFEKALGVAERLVQQDPSNTQFQRDVSVSYNKLGAVHLRLGATSQAVSFFEKDLALAERLVQQDPSNTEFQRDVSVSYNKLGDVHLRLGATAQAVSLFEKALAVAKRLVQHDPSNTEFQRDIWVSYWKFAQVHEKTGDRDRAIQAFIAAQDRLQAMHTGGVLAADDVRFLDEVARRIAALRGPRSS